MKITAPKLTPKFTLLLAGCDNQKPLNFQSLKALSEITKNILKTLNKNVENAELIYGEINKKVAELSVLVGNRNPEILSFANKVVSELNLKLDIVHCGNYVQEETFADQASKTVVLGHNTSNTDLLFQEIQIQEATLRTFSDILIWIGDCADTPVENRSLRLLRDTILEGKPVIWLHNQGMIEIIDYRLLDEPHRLLLLTTEESQKPIRSLFVNYNYEILVNDLMFTSNPIELQSPKHNRTKETLLCYFQEHAPSKLNEKTAGRLDKLLSAIIKLQGFRKAFSLKLNEPWYGVEGDQTLIDQNLQIKEPQGLKDRFSWSDRIANIAAGRQRDTIWLIYFLSTLAVFSAVAGAIHLGHLPDWLWPTTEILTIFGILFTYWKSTKLDLHGKWLFHRFLAEQIRYTRLGYPLLTFQEPLLAPLRYSTLDDQEKVVSYLKNAETWILKRTIVGAGLPSLLARNEYRPHTLNDHLTSYVIGIIKDQIDYHDKKHHSEHKVEHRLHGFSTAAFILTGIAVITHFFIHAEELLILTGALPALAASIHGITTMNEMGRVSQLSSHTANELNQMIESIHRLKEHHNEGENYFIQLRNLTHESAFVMSNVNRQWQDLIQHQQTTLPA